MSVKSASVDVLAERPRPIPEGAASPRRSTGTALAQRLTPGGFFHLTMLGLALLFCLISAVGLPLTRLSFRPQQLVPTLFLLTVLLAAARLCALRRSPKVVAALTLLAWAYAFGHLCTVPTFIAVRTQAPLIDEQLARLDAALGVEVPAVLEFVEANPRLRQGLDFCYRALIGLMMLALVVPPLCGKVHAAKQYSVGTLLAILICLPIVAMFPGRGPWVVYGYAPSTSQELFMRTFADLRTQEWYVIDLNYSAGLICFPSFHTVLPVLAGAALWRVPYVRWPAAVLAALIVISTVTTGWHYLIDVVAGLLLAALAQALAVGYSRLEARMARPVRD
jgi:hypothetical protein